MCVNSWMHENCICFEMIKWKINEQNWNMINGISYLPNQMIIKFNSNWHTNGHNELEINTWNDTNTVFNILPIDWTMMCTACPLSIQNFNIEHFVCVCVLFVIAYCLIVDATEQVKSNWFDYPIELNWKLYAPSANIKGKMHRYLYSVIFRGFCVSFAIEIV